MQSHSWKATSALGAALALTLGAQARTEFVRSFEVDPEKYVGVWYEIARTPNDFEDNLPSIGGIEYGPCLAPTATYTLLGSDRIGVHNSCARAAISDVRRQTQSEVTGVAHVEEGSQQRKLKVAFGNKAQRFLQRVFTGGGADYWIYGLGPEQDGQYSWALVSGKKRDNIFVLARTKDLGTAQMAEILALAEREGLPTEELIFTQR